MVGRCNHSWDKFYFLCGLHTPLSLRLSGLGGLEKLASASLSTHIFPPLRVLFPSGLTENTLAYPGNHVEEWRISLLMVPIGEDNIKNSLKNSLTKNSLLVFQSWQFRDLEDFLKSSLL